MSRFAVVCLLTFTAADAAAFVPYTAGDNALHWTAEQKALPLTIVEKDSPLPSAAFREVVDRAFQQWADVGGAVPEAQVRETVKEAVDDDKTHQIQFLAQDWPFDPNALAVTVFSYKKSSGVLVDADIFVNATGPCLADASEDRSCYDLESVLTHEAGHFLGLDHNPDDADTVMYPSAKAGGTKRALSLDDKQGVIATYGGQMDAAAEPPANVEQQASVNMQDASRRGCAAAGLPLWLIVLLLVGGRAHASSVARESLANQMSRSDAVFVAHAVSKRSYFDVGLGFIVTEHNLEVDECVQGSCATAITFRTLGGEVGDLVTRVSGESEPPQGQSALFVASKRKLGSGFVFESTAFGQGVLPLDKDLGVFRSRTQWLRVDELRR